MSLYPVKDLLQSVMQKHGMNEEAVVYGEKLEQILSRFSDDAAIVQQKDHTLVIVVSSSAVLQELMMKKREILCAFQEQDTTLSNITFKMRGRT